MPRCTFAIRSGDRGRFSQSTRRGLPVRILLIFLALVLACTDVEPEPIPEPIPEPTPASTSTPLPTPTSTSTPLPTPTPTPLPTPTQADRIDTSKRLLEIELDAINRGGVECQYKEYPSEHIVLLSYCEIPGPPLMTMFSIALTNGWELVEVREAVELSDNYFRLDICIGTESQEGVEEETKCESTYGNSEEAIVFMTEPYLLWTTDPLLWEEESLLSWTTATPTPAPLPTSTLTQAERIAIKKLALNIQANEFGGECQHKEYPAEQIALLSYCEIRSPFVITMLVVRFTEGMEASETRGAEEVSENFYRLDTCIATRSRAEVEKKVPEEPECESTHGDTEEAALFISELFLTWTEY